MEGHSVFQEKSFVASDSPQIATRKPRADAERNRQKLLHAARAAFTMQGALASMDEIAKSAGVGIGTLYRHFPTREGLILEVYRGEIARLCEAAEDLAKSKPPLEALKGWLLLFVDHLADNIALGDAVKASAGDSKADVTAQLNIALDLLFDRPVAAGTIADPGIASLDLLRALYGVATASPDSDWPKAARRMVDILIVGMARS